MKKRYLKPQETLVSMEKELPIIAASGGGGTDEPINTGDPDIGGGGSHDGEPIEEGGAPAFGIIDD